MDKKDFWVARCDLLEKTKLRVDSEGIRFAFPQLDLHINADPSGTGKSIYPSPYFLAGTRNRETKYEENI